MYQIFTFSTVPKKFQYVLFYSDKNSWRWWLPQDLRFTLTPIKRGSKAVERFCTLCKWMFLFAPSTSYTYVRNLFFSLCGNAISKKFHHVIQKVNFLVNQAMSYFSNSLLYKIVSIVWNTIYTCMLVILYATKCNRWLQTSWPSCCQIFFSLQAILKFIIIRESEWLLKRQRTVFVSI